jgi:hypothetical protein
MIINFVRANMETAASKIKKEHRRIRKHAYNDLIPLNVRIMFHQFAVRKPEL